LPSPPEIKQTLYGVCRSGKTLAGAPHDGDAAGERPHPNFSAIKARAKADSMTPASRFYPVASLTYVRDGLTAFA
jgi:hypothetical protein